MSNFFSSTYEQVVNIVSRTVVPVYTGDVRGYLDGLRYYYDLSSDSIQSVQGQYETVRDILSVPGMSDFLADEAIRFYSESSDIEKGRVLAEIPFAIGTTLAGVGLVNGASTTVDLGGFIGKIGSQLQRIADAVRGVNGRVVPNNTGPNLNTLEGVTSEINRNADVAVELTRRALERGRITDSAQAFGTRAHKLFEGLNNRLDRRLGDQGSSFSIISEEFRDAAGDVTSRRARGSIGADVKILDTDNSDFIRVLDLKTHGGKEIPISPSRQQQFIDRFGAPAEEIFRQR